MCPMVEEKCARCGEAFLRSDARVHIEECTKALVKCSYCLVWYPRDKLAEHLNTCPEMTVGCEFCFLPIPQNHMAAHVAQCPDAPITCPECGEMYTRITGERHRTYVCQHIQTIRRLKARVAELESQLASRPVVNIQVSLK